MADELTSGMFPIPLPVFMTEKPKKTKYEEEQEEREEKTNELIEEQIDNSEEQSGQTNSFLKRIFGISKDGWMTKGITKLRDKIVKADYKWIVQNRYYQATIKALKGIKNAIGGNILDLLLGLLAFAFFDPNGTLLGGLIGFLATLFITIVKVFAELLPKLIPIILKLIPVIVKSLTFIITEIIKLLPLIFKTIIQLIPVIFKAIIAIASIAIDTFIALIPVIFDILITIIPMIIKGIGDIIKNALGKLGEKFPVLKTAISHIIKIIDSITSFFDSKTVGKILKIMGLIFLTISGIGILAFAIYYFWDDITEFISEGIYFIRFKFFELIMWLKSLYLTFKKNLIKAKNDLVSIVKNLVNNVINKFKSIWDTITDYLNPKNLITSVSKALTSLLENIPGFDIIKNFFNVTLPGLIDKAFESIPGLKQIAKFFNDLLTTMGETSIGRLIIGKEDKREQIFQKFETILPLIKRGESGGELDILSKLIVGNKEDARRLLKQALPVTTSDTNISLLLSQFEIIASELKESNKVFESMSKESLKTVEDQNIMLNTISLSLSKLVTETENGNAKNLDGLNKIEKATQTASSITAPIFSSKTLEKTKP